MVKAHDVNGKLLGTLTLFSPSALPNTVYYLDEVPEEGVKITPFNETTKVLNNTTEVKKLNDTDGTSIKEYLAEHAMVEVHIADSRWSLGSKYLFATGSGTGR